MSSLNMPEFLNWYKVQEEEDYRMLWMCQPILRKGRILLGKQQGTI
jgi:hypothetical protein